jgi:hypothetical protein
MNFFKKLFGKPKSIDEQVEDLFKNFKVEIKVTSTSSSDQIDSINQTPEEKLKDYNITEIKKQAVQVYNESGLMAAIDFLKNFIESKNLEFEEFIRLIKEIITYSKNEKSISEDQLIEYINDNLNKYQEKDDPKQQINIYEILKRVNPQIGLQYLEGILGDYNSDVNKSPDHIELFILLSEIYLKDKQADRAFGLMQRANNLTTKIDDRFYFTWKHLKIAEMSAEICLKGQKKPQYADYLHYTIFAFIMDIAKDITSFPYWYQFFYRKKICENREWGLHDNEDFDLALEDLKILNHKEALISDIYNFTFNELPLKMGIPKEYFIENLYPDDIGAIEFSDRVQELAKVEEKFNKGPYLEHVFISQFASKVVKKYYDMNN